MKLGIVAAPEFANSAALLTAELSKNSGSYELLERDAIDHVLQEQGIAKSGATAGDWVKAGRILAADGLVLLQKRNTGENETTNVGWVLSVNTGVVLGAEPLPKEEKAQLEVLKGLLERCNAKMAVKVGEAVPVSVVPAEGVTNTKEIDRDIFQNGVMLALMREPSVFVLQREQLETVLFERNFAGAGSEQFWGGANVVRCRIGPDPLDNGTLTAALSLKRKDGSSENWVQKAGTPQQLAIATAAAITTRLHLGDTAPAYDPQKELPYFRAKLKRLLSSGIPKGGANVDTAITLQALGDSDCLPAQLAVFSPVVKVCGNYSYARFEKAHSEPKAVITAVRQTVELEQARLQTLAAQRKDLGSRAVTDPNLLDDLMSLVQRVLYYYCVTGKATDVQPELSALRKQTRDYLQLARSLKWTYPGKYLLQYGEYFYDDPKEWLDSVETALSSPSGGDPLFTTSQWLHDTVMQVPRHEGGDLYGGRGSMYADEPTPSPETLAVSVPRMKLWTQRPEPALRLVGARVLLRKVGVPIDQPAMARVAVQALGEILPAHCRLRGPADPFPHVYEKTGFWLQKVEPLAHKELLDLSIRTLGWAEGVNMAYLFTQPADKEEAALLGQAYQTASARLHSHPKGFPFDLARRAYPEAFLPNASQPIQQNTP